jgi:hypothetical protein
MTTDYSLITIFNKKSPTLEIKNVLTLSDHSIISVEDGGTLKLSGGEINNGEIILLDGSVFRIQIGGILRLKKENSLFVTDGALFELLDGEVINNN